MLGVGSSIWNRALAGKGAGDGGNPPAEATPIHSLDLTTAPSASNAFDDYGLATSRTVTDYNGRIVQIPADAVPMGGLRPVYNLCTSPNDITSRWGTINSTINGADSFTPSANWGSVYQALSNWGLTKAGHTIVVSFEAKTDSGASVHTHIFALGGSSISGTEIELTTEYRRYSQALVMPTDGTGDARVSIRHFSGSGGLGSPINVRNIQTQDITHRADLSTAPDEFVSTDDDYGTGVNGFRYFDTELDNTVDGSGVVNEGTGASIEGWGDWQPGDTNYADCTHDFSGGADTITLTATGYYTLWLEGTAQVTVAAGTATITGAGAATEGSPVTINCTATGTITLTMNSGTLDEWGAYQIIQLNDGTVPTAFIPSTGSASRPAMSPAPTISGLVGTEDARLVVKGLAADLVTPDPTDTTERTLDIDNTDGEFDTLPSPIKILSVDVYNDGERPA